MTRLVGIYHPVNPYVIANNGGGGADISSSSSSSSSSASSSPIRSSSASSSSSTSSSTCLGRRQMPLNIEPDLTLIMSLDEDGCLACGINQKLASLVTNQNPNNPQQQPNNRNNKKYKMNPRDLESFYKKYESLSKDEMTASFIVSFDAVMNVMSQEIPCVGCRRAVEILYQNLLQLAFSSSPSAPSPSSLEPLIITPSGEISVERSHLSAPNALAYLFGPQLQRLTDAVLSRGDFNTLHSNKHHSKKSGNGRCAAHSLDRMKKVVSTELWKEIWENMEPVCREAVTVIPVKSLRQTLDRYLKKHSFCGECSAMVNKAFAYLVEYGVEPSQAVKALSGSDDDDDEDEDDDDMDDLDDEMSCHGSESAKLSRNNYDDNLYNDISVCTYSSKPEMFPSRYRHEDVSDEGGYYRPRQQHVHIKCSEGFVAKLMALAEPELTGLRQERHARTIAIAQKEILTCIGITLFERFQRIQQKLKEGQQSCDLIVLMSLKTLKSSFEMALERKRGLSDLEKLCRELDEEDKKKAEKQEKKRSKKKNAANKKKMMLLAANAEKENEIKNNQPPPPPPPQEKPTKIKANNKASNKRNNNKTSSVKIEEIKVPPSNNIISSSSSSSVDSSSSPPFSPKKTIVTPFIRKAHDEYISILSLDKMLSNNDNCIDYDDVDDGEDGIPVEDVQKFMDQNSDVMKQRAQIRQNLRQRFAQMCKNNVDSCRK